eukprot:SAG22_NODE_13398_length_408_cov_0.831715_1_plen_114_part_01
MAGRARDQVRLSKNLSFLLRHGAEKAGLEMGADGYVPLADVLALPQLSRWSAEDVREVVRTNDKQRFALERQGGVEVIRANQGHTLRTVEDEALLTEIVDPAELPVCVHGTYLA